MRIAATLFAALFVIGAVVQWNDPDPVIWMLAYATAAGLSLAAAFGRSLFLPNLIAALVFGVWFLTIASSLAGAPQEAFTSFKMQSTSHEEPREAGGLALMTGWSAVLCLHARRGGAGRISKKPEA